MAMIRFKFIRVGEKFNFHSAAARALASTEKAEFTYTKKGTRTYTCDGNGCTYEILSTDMMVYQAKGD